MDDVEIVTLLAELVDEEHRLERAHADQSPTDAERDRQLRVETALARCLELLRQRAASPSYFDLK